MFSFHNIEFLWLLVLIIPCLYLLKKQGDISTIFSPKVLKKISVNSNIISKRARSILLLLAIALSIIALARPQLNNGEIKVQSSFINVITAIDMSKSMFANDVYPSRFEFAKKKFFDSLKYFKNTKVALIGFSTQPFLISPLTQDFGTLSFLGKNLDMSHLSLNGTDILATLSSANEMFGQEKTKILLIFTDGDDQKDFSKEIKYAKENKIVIYIYNIGTTKGGIIKDENGVLKDSEGNIVVVKRTDNIKTLALQTGGAYMKYSFASNDIKILVDNIRKSFKATNIDNSTIKDLKEMFYYPLSLALFLFFVSLFSLPYRRMK